MICASSSGRHDIAARSVKLKPNCSGGASGALGQIVLRAGPDRLDPLTVEVTTGAPIPVLPTLLVQIRSRRAMNSGS